MTDEEKEDNRQLILIAEDDEFIHQVLSNILEAEGYRVAIARDGEEALNFARSLMPALMLLDRRMPKLNGIDVLRRLKAEERTKQIPVLFLTGVGDEQAHVEGLDAGAADYIVKPFERSILLARVRVQLRLKRQEDELRRQREAAEERNVLLTMKNADLARLNEFKTHALLEFGGGEESHLGRLRELVQRARDLVTTADEPKLGSALDGVLEATRQIDAIIQPQDFYGQAEQALAGRDVLVVDRDRSFRRLTARAVFATGANVHTAETAEEAIALVEQSPIAVVFADWESADLLESMSSLDSPPETVLMTNEDLFEGEGARMLELPLSSVVIANVLARTERHDPMAVREIVTTAGKLLTKDIFGLEKYLGWGTMIHSGTVKSSNGRHEMLTRIYDYALQCGLRSKVARSVETLADELLMNAIWDAPIDEGGEPRYAERPRHEPIDLEPNEYATIQYGCDGNFLAIGVRDNFGRLQHERAFRYPRPMLRSRRAHPDQLRCRRRRPRPLHGIPDGVVLHHQRRPGEAHRGDRAV